MSTSKKGESAVSTMLKNLSFCRHGQYGRLESWNLPSSKLVFASVCNFPSMLTFSFKFRRKRLVRGWLLWKHRCVAVLLLSMTITVGRTTIDSSQIYLIVPNNVGHGTQSRGLFYRKRERKQRGREESWKERERMFIAPETTRPRGKRHECHCDEGRNDVGEASIS